MSDTTPAFESPSFANDADDEFDDDLDDDFTDSDDVQVGAVDADETSEQVDRVNQVEGGAAKAVAEHIARSIVDDPDAVVVDVAADRAGVRLSLHVAPGDMGRIIGKRGRVAQALRALVRAAAAKDGTDASVDIVD